jgi:hypothetical protein
MTTEEARQLLTTIIEAERVQGEPEAVEELIQYCVGRHCCIEAKGVITMPQVGAMPLS